MINETIKTALPESITYQEYTGLVNQLVAEEGTSGPEQTEARIAFTKLNASRMRRLDKTLTIAEQELQTFKGLQERQTWLVFLESWCADGAQTIPILNKIAQEVPVIDLKILFRDEHTELMDHFLTHGTRSIPKLVILDRECKVLTTWGPRSKKATAMVMAYKAQFGKIDDTFKQTLQLWYTKNKGEAIVQDLVEIFELGPSLDYGKAAK